MDFDDTSTFIGISLFSSIRQSYVELMHFAHKVHYWIGNWWGPQEQYIHWKLWNMSDKLCCEVPIDLLEGIPLNLALVINQLEYSA